MAVLTTATEQILLNLCFKRYCNKKETIAVKFENVCFRVSEHR